MAARPLVLGSSIGGFRSLLLLLLSCGGRACRGRGLASPFCGGHACRGLGLISPPCGALSLQRRLHGGLLGLCLARPLQGPRSLGRRSFLRGLLPYGRNGGWRCRHLFNHLLRAVLPRGRSSLTPRLVSRWCRRRGARHLSKLAEPSPLRRRKVAEKKSKQKILQEDFQRQNPKEKGEGPGLTRQPSSTPSSSPSAAGG